MNLRTFLSLAVAAIILFNSGAAFSAPVQGTPTTVNPGGQAPGGMLQAPIAPGQQVAPAAQMPMQAQTPAPATGRAVSTKNASGSSDIIADIKQTVASWSGYLEALAILCFMLALLWAIVWLLRKRSNHISGQELGLRVENRLPLGPKQWLVVARCMDKRILLGMTEHQVTLLTEMPLYSPTAPQAAGAAPVTAQQQAQNFQAQLRAAKTAQENPASAPLTLNKI